MPSLIDITGHRYGRLTVRGPAGRNEAGARVWECRCDCGRSAVVASNPLRMGGTSSCGCLATERRNANAKHGHARGRAASPDRSPTYRSWRAMHDRCYQPATSGYPWYGALGVRVCARWHDFRNFLADMGERPSGKTLDRENPFGDYEPGNCQWSTRQVQSISTRANWLKANERSPAGALA